MIDGVSVFSLQCPNCAASLPVGLTLRDISCSYCGSRLMVERTAGTIWLKSVGKTLNSVRIGVDRTAAELAIVRLSKELAAAERELSVLITGFRETEQALVSAFLVLGWQGPAGIALMVGIACIWFGFLGLRQSKAAIALTSPKLSEVRKARSLAEPPLEQVVQDLRRRLAEQRRIADMPHEM